MRQYLRWRVPGGTYFLTLVTHQRRKILTTDLGRKCLREAIEETQGRWPFVVVAIVLMPDHLHCVLELPRGDANYSLRIQRLKGSFTRRYLATGGREGEVSRSRQRKGEHALWQRRFWEHTIRDEEDLKRCVDYIHWNPVKHGLVRRVRYYPWSSFHRFAKLGEYEIDWGGVNPVSDEHGLGE